ncbi:MAG TPA: lipid-binding SYLF domain-containing protein [Terriglobia bacterium]|nr:lipid-binding SYLF domain-containing protein [Terriglobia bacterium]
MKIRFLTAALILAATAVPALAASGRQQDVDRIRSSRFAFEDIMNAPDRGIPQELLGSAKCIAIIPGEKSAAFVFGGSYGRGLVTCLAGDHWSAPAFLLVSGGSFGFQIGGSSTDLVMIFRNRGGMDRLLSDKFKVGADASAAAGPVGRRAAAATDVEMHAEILTYSRSRGVFAGVSLNGAVVKPDRDADIAMYGADIEPASILGGHVEVPAEAAGLINVIARDVREAGGK